MNQDVTEPRICNKMQKISAFSREGRSGSTEYSLDKWFITSLLRQGKIKAVSEFDFAKEAKNPNNEALAFAEQTGICCKIMSLPESINLMCSKDSEKAKYLWMLQDSL